MPVLGSADFRPPFDVDEGWKVTQGCSPQQAPWSAPRQETRSPSPSPEEPWDPTEDGVIVWGDASSPPTAAHFTAKASATIGSRWGADAREGGEEGEGGAAPSLQLHSPTCVRRSFPASGPACGSRWVRTVIWARVAGLAQIVGMTHRRK